MKIMPKVISIWVLVFLMIMAVLFFLQETWIFPRFAALEYELGERSIRRVYELVDGRIDYMASVSRDLGVWDETKDYMEGNNPEYTATNFPPDAFRDTGFDGVILYDIHNKVRLGLTYDAGKDAVTARIPQELLKYPSRLVNAFDGTDPAGKGILLVDGHRAYYGIHAIRGAKRGLAVNGMLLTYRFINDKELDYLAKIAGYDFAVYDSLPSAIERVGFLDENGKESEKKPFYMQEDKNELVGYGIVYDYRGAPSFVFSQTIGRNITYTGLSGSRFFIIYLIVAVAIIISIGLLILNSQVISRILKLQAAVTDLDVSSDQLNCVIAGKDEISELSVTVHTMWDTLNRHAHLLGEMQEELIVARDKAERAARDKSDFLAMMSHEIRAPLNGIMGLSEKIAAEMSDLRSQQDLQLLENTARMLLHLLNNILDCDRLEKGKLSVDHLDYRPEDLLEEISIIHSANAEKKGLVFNLINALPARLVICGDPVRTRQILDNLLHNAIKFTERGQICLRAYLEKGNISFVVQDTGIGIGEEKQGALFDAYYQTKDDGKRGLEGSGLGLAICQQLAVMMNGVITVESKLGEGSSFQLLLPLEYGSEANLLPVNIMGERLPGHLLIVEDDQLSRELLVKSLQDRFVCVSAVSSGEEALTAAQNKQLNYILLDLYLPDINGFAVARSIRKMEGELGQIVIIANTSYEGDDLESLTLAAGIDGYIRKTNNVANIIYTIQKIISSAERLEMKDALNCIRRARQDVQERMGISDDLFIHYMKEFFKYWKDSLREKLLSACEQHQTADVLHCLHKLKGQLLLVGLEKLAETAEEMIVFLRADADTDYTGFGKTFVYKIDSVEVIFTGIYTAQEA